MDIRLRNGNQHKHEAYGLGRKADRNPDRRRLFDAQGSPAPDHRAGAGRLQDHRDRRDQPAQAERGASAGVPIASVSGRAVPARICRAAHACPALLPDNCRISEEGER